MSENLTRLVALGIQVDSEDKITDEVNRIAAALCKTDGEVPSGPEFAALDRLHLGVVLGIHGVTDIDSQPVDCILGGVNHIAKNSARFRTTAAYRTFLREWVAGWQLADEWEDQNTGTDDDRVVIPLQIDDEPPYFEPGRYVGVRNADYHASNGISSSMAKDARVSLMYYHGRHVTKIIKRERSKVLDFGAMCHALVLEPENLDEEFSIEPVIPEGAFTTTDTMKKFIEEYNATLPAPLSTDEIKSMLSEHNTTLPSPIPLGGSVDEVGQAYMSLSEELKTIPGDAKHTSAAMKACIKEYNATLPAPLPTTGNREALLSTLEQIEPEIVAAERIKPAPLNVSGRKDDLMVSIKSVAPDAVFAFDILGKWQSDAKERTMVPRAHYVKELAIRDAVMNHPSSGPIINHPTRSVEVSYYGYDDDTGLEIRVRPDLEIEINGLRIGFDLKTISTGKYKQAALRARIHREIIDRDYHLSAAMYCDLAALDQFFWIFVNKDEDYNWILIVEASPDELELGRLEYKATLRAIKESQDTGIWPAPITDVLVDELNDFDLRRLEALRAAYAA